MWPAVIVKELIDNALAACETVGVSPIITIQLDANALTVSDNGAGAPEIKDSSGTLAGT
jgi:DNA topoisomerase VI subunit B